MDSISRPCVKEKGRQEEGWEKEVKSGGSEERKHLVTDRGNWQMLMSCDSPFLLKLSCETWKWCEREHLRKFW